MRNHGVFVQKLRKNLLQIAALDQYSDDNAVISVIDDPVRCVVLKQTEIACAESAFSAPAASAALA